MNTEKCKICGENAEETFNVDSQDILVCNVCCSPHQPRTAIPARQFLRLIKRIEKLEEKIHNMCTAQCDPNKGEG